MTEEINNTPTANQEEVLTGKKEETIEFKWSTILSWGLYILGGILIVICIIKLNQDLTTYRGEFRFEEETYVGGDAYNYIISAARSSAVMIKALIYGLLGCSSIISGLLIKIINK
ncbi:MAG: hypothetical protein U0L77_09710 [Prevotellamassilia sp.]|nr:hypothetical protein [Prevotellamassilia sp.]